MRDASGARAMPLPGPRASALIWLDVCAGKQQGYPAFKGYSLFDPVNYYRVGGRRPRSPIHRLEEDLQLDIASADTLRACSHR